METKKRAVKATVRRVVADKLIKVNAGTHMRLKVKAAQAGKSIGELLEDFSKK